ncbi:MAG: hypothetical protein JWN30_2588, partial [Bacilli bacterium]|nr:hypothetical protein [Bacilli bacterium]
MSMGTIKRSPENQRKSIRFSHIKFKIFLLCIYIMVSTTVLALYGPFENIRRMLIGAVLTSSHPWVIKPFYPGSILAKYLPISVDTMSKGT